MLKATKTIPAANVDEYIHIQPQEVRGVLQKLRETIRTAAPGAEETISYQVPTFKYKGMLVCFAAFKNHCSFYTTRHSIMKAFKDELGPYKTSGVTIHFTTEDPLPASLVEKLVKARIAENEARLKPKKRVSEKSDKPAVKKSNPVKMTDAAIVDGYMNKLQHPLKAEIEAVRIIIKNANKKIAERIKWNAPSYYYRQDMVTFNPRAPEHVHLIFHHPAIATIPSAILEGDYKDRRMVYLPNMKEIKANKKELVNIINELVKIVDK